MSKEVAHQTKRRLKLEIKEITDQGVFEGILSPYGNVDGGDDMVEPGSFTKTLKEQGNTRPLLWQHKTDTPIGQLTLIDQPDGLHCQGQLLMEDPDAQKAYRFLKARIVKGLSIGFETIKDSVEKGVRHLKEIKLYEGSIVTFPMNEMALVTSVKHRVKQDGAPAADEGPEDFNEELAEIQLADAVYQMRSALSNCLDCCLYSGMDKAGIIAMSGTCIQQFSDAYLAMLPDYLNMMEGYYGGMEMWSKQRLEKKFVTKAGATYSVATKAAIKSNCEMIKSGHDNLLALVSDGADDAEKAAATLDGHAAKLPKSEPETDHSAAQIQSALEALRSMIPCATGNQNSN